ncbi:MAG TPA: response regulator transcription factor [Burkholderiaceae bacterium]|jgi:CheY-like chemotaxis protein/DNA-binding CsgD family transcriptional regulator|nr:response regulator transcription factor [Burkholderiaceae bacterium]
MNPPRLRPVANEDVVLIVDDVPDNLALLHDALDESGYAVLVATSGEAALQRCRDAQPDIVLLDAMMPGLDGFAVAVRLKASAETAHIPIVFMTGLTETEHVVRAFEAGGVDYVTKPIRPAEVLARISAHLRQARQGAQQRNALDAFGQAALSVRAVDSRILWQTPLARKLCTQYLGAAAGPILPAALGHWVETQASARSNGRPAMEHTLVQGTRRLTLALHEDTGDGEWLVVLRETSDAAVADAMVLAFRLTAREAEVLYWVVKGKINRDIADILGMSPRTVNKHLEHVFQKLGVETRTAAASIVMQRVPSLVA